MRSSAATIADDPAGRLAAARDLQVHPRRHAREHPRPRCAASATASSPTSGAGARLTCRSPTSDELVMLASIVEKETALADERSRVAAVFINRLRLNMRLQSDPDGDLRPVRGQGKARGLHAEQAPTSTPSRPTTPTSSTACRPARSPIPAAPRSRRSPIRRAPATSIFVADGTGGHAFAETYEEHLRNVARWRAVERRRRRGAPTPAAAKRCAPRRRRPGADGPRAAPTSRRPRRCPTTAMRP